MGVIIGNEHINSLMFDSRKTTTHTGEITYFKRHNDAGGYWVHGLWVAMTVNNDWVHWYPWEFGVPSGACKDINDGWARWGYVQDGLVKNLTNGMTVTWSGQNGPYGIALTFWSNDENYIDESGRKCFDFGEFPLIITFLDGRFDDVDWYIPDGNIVNISDDKRTITVYRTNLQVGDKVICRSRTSSWDITTAKAKFNTLKANVTGLTRHFTDWTEETIGGEECWNAYCNGEHIYHKEPTKENYLDKYGISKYTMQDVITNNGDFNLEQEIKKESYNILNLNKPETCTSTYYKLKPINLSSYVHKNSKGVINIPINLGVKPTNENFWNPIKEWISDNKFTYFAVQNMFQNCGLKELTITISDNNLYFAYLDYFVCNSDIESIELIFDENSSQPLSSINCFNLATKLKTIKSSIPLILNQASGMFEWCYSLIDIPSDLINYESYYVVCTTSKPIHQVPWLLEGTYSLMSVPISTVNNPNQIRDCSANTIIPNWAQQMLNASNVRYFGPVVDCRFLNPLNNKQIFTAGNLQDIRIKNLNHGDWIMDGVEINGLCHCDAANLNAESVEYLFANLYDLTTYDPETTVSVNNCFAKWTINNWARVGFTSFTNIYSDITCGTNSALECDFEIKGLEEGDYVNICDVLTVTENGIYHISKPETTNIKYITFSRLRDDKSAISVTFYNSKADSATPMVDHANLYIPNSWYDKVTTEMIQSANSKGWSIYVNRTLVTEGGQIIYNKSLLSTGTVDSSLAKNEDGFLVINKTITTSTSSAAWYTNNAISSVTFEVSGLTGDMVLGVGGGAISAIKNKVIEDGTYTFTSLSAPWGFKLWSDTITDANVIIKIHA